MNERPSDDAVVSNAIADEREQLGASNLDEGDYFILRQCHGVLRARARARARASSIVGIARDVIAELGDVTKLPQCDDALVIAVAIELAKRWRSRTGGDDYHQSTSAPRAPRDAASVSADVSRWRQSRDATRERSRPPNHITAQEFALATGRAYKTIQTAAAIGRIPSIKIRAWRFVPLTAIAEWCDNNSAGATPSSGRDVAVPTGTFSDLQRVADQCDRRRQPKSAEHRAKISAALRGRTTGKPLSPEHRAKISASQLGRPKSPEAVARRTATMRARRLAEAGS